MEGDWATLDEVSTEKLGALIKGRNVLAVLSGHIHLNRFALWQGVPVLINGGQQSTIDLTCSDGLVFVEGTSFTICDLTPHGIKATFVPLQEPRVVKEISAQELRALSS